jgi:hypothetical protein
MEIMKGSVLRQRRADAWEVRRHPVDSGLNEGEMKSVDRMDHQGVAPREPPRRIGVKSRKSLADARSEGQFGYSLLKRNELAWRDYYT